MDIIKSVQGELNIFDNDNPQLIFFTQLFSKFPQKATFIVRKLSAGEFLFKENQPSFNVCIMLKGKASPYYDNTGQNYFIKSVFTCGDIVGDTAVLANIPSYSASVIALSDVTIIEINKSDYISWIYSDDKLLKARTESVIKVLLAELSQKRTLECASNDVRILYYFLSCFKLSENNQSRKIIINKTREKIAEEIGGISVKTINRKLAIFSQQDIITLVKGKIHISLQQRDRMESIITDQQYKTQDL